MAKYVGFKIGKAHESHVISEYYCGGCGWPVTDHDSFCPECGGAFRECDASNLEDENAKLRELVSGLEYCAQGHICDCCPLYDQSGTNHRRCESLERELGIEVP